MWTEVLTMATVAVLIHDQDHVSEQLIDIIVVTVPGQAQSQYRAAGQQSGGHIEQKET